MTSKTMKMHELSETVLATLTDLVSTAEKWLKRVDQLELTLLEYRFNVDLRATVGAAKAYIEGETFSDHQLLRATLHAAVFCGQCMKHDAQIYDHYFNGVNEFLPQYAAVCTGRLPLARRDDSIAVRSREA